MSLATVVGVVYQTLVIYIVLVIAISIFSKRQRGQLNAMDVVVMLLLGSAVETAMVQASTSLRVGIVSATTLFVANKLCNILTRKWHWLGSVLNNPPLVLVSDGKVVPHNLKVASLTMDDLLEGIRARGEAGLASVRYAVLEADGVISVVPKRAH